MLIFHEGLPRSGKSYEAVKSNIGPALLAGRKVFAYINGLNHAKIAEVLGLTEQRVRELLIVIPKEQVKEIYKHVENDALVVIDELQNFWPSGKDKLEPGITEFVTEHGHRGLDILAMGQDLRDCHALWKRRVALKFRFLKQDAVGLENSYVWSSWKPQGDSEKFIKINSGTKRYDPKWFGTYASHKEETTNTGNHKDSRANIFSSSLFRVVLPGAFAVGFVAVWYLVSFFRGGGVETKPAQPASVQSQAAAVASAPAISAPTLPAPVPAAVVKETPADPPEYLDEVSVKYRARLAGVIEARGRVNGLVEFLDPSYRAQETLTLKQIEAMGWAVKVEPYGVTLAKGKKSYVVTSWPIEPVGSIPEKVRESNEINGKPPVSAAG